MAERTKQFSICEEIIFEILKNLPSKSLMKFRCVSKDWLRLIENPYFVDCHRVCPHTGTCGILLLSSNVFPSTDHDFPSCYMLDPEGNCRTGSFPLPSNFNRYSISNAEALVCFGDCVWNPSTRETMNLPPVNNCFSSLIYKDYRLGFDAFTNKYKVVVFYYTKQVPEFHVLTLGENSWKRIPFRVIPEELRDGFGITLSKSFSNMIFCLIKGTSNHKFDVLTFDVHREQVGFISLPYEVLSFLTNDSQLHLAEIDGRLAFKEGYKKAIWVLDHENIIARWTKMEITIDGFPDTDTFVFYGQEYLKKRLIPIGTFYTNEILFRYIAEKKEGMFGRTLLKHFYYDPETKNIRFVPKLNKIADVTWHDLMIKHVDSILRLKPAKKLG